MFMLFVVQEEVIVCEGQYPCVHCSLAVGNYAGGEEEEAVCHRKQRLCALPEVLGKGCPPRAEPLSTPQSSIETECWCDAGRGCVSPKKMFR